jgi:HK97 family phage portal protein
MSPIEYAAESIGLNLAARKFGAGFFGDGGHPSAILAPERDPGEDGAKAMKQGFIAATRGNREPVVMPQSVKYTPIQVNPEESQFLESQRFSVEDICRFFGVPPEMIGAASSGSSVTYANREQRAVDFLTFGLDPWLLRLEEMLTDQMPRPQVAKINRAALLRTDTLTRYQAHAIAKTNGWRNINEIRRIEDEPGIGPDGDVYVTGAATPTEGATP